VGSPLIRGMDFAPPLSPLQFENDATPITAHPKTPALSSYHLGVSRCTPGGKRLASCLFSQQQCAKRRDRWPKSSRKGDQGTTPPPGPLANETKKIPEPPKRPKRTPPPQGPSVPPGAWVGARRPGRRKHLHARRGEVLVVHVGVGPSPFPGLRFKPRGIGPGPHPLPPDFFSGPTPMVPWGIGGHCGGWGSQKNEIRLPT